MSGVRSVASINKPPSIQRHIQRLARLRLSLAKTEDEERKKSLQEEINTRSSVLAELQKQIQEGLETCCGSQDLP